MARSPTGTDGETRGRVADRPLSEVVKDLADQRFTGTVALNLGPLEGTLTFEQGQVTSARLGDLSGRTAFFRAMAATAGAFAIKPAKAGRVQSSLGEVTELLDQVKKHDTEIRSLAGDVGGLDRVWGIRFGALKRVLTVLPDEINPLLRLLDGRRTVREVLAATTLDDVLVLRVMHRLLTMGVLVLPDDHLEGGAASPVGDSLDGGRVAVIGSDLEVSAQWFEEHSQPGRAAPPLKADAPKLPKPEPANAEKAESPKTESKTEKAAAKSAAEAKAEKAEAKPTEKVEEEPKAEKAEAKPAEDPKAEKAEKAEAKPAEDPKTETAEEPKAEKVEEPKAETVEEPKAEKAEAPNAEKAEDPKTEKAEEPKAEKLEEPKTERAEAKPAENVEAPKPDQPEDAPSEGADEQADADKASEEPRPLPALPPEPQPTSPPEEVAIKTWSTSSDEPPGDDDDGFDDGRADELATTADDLRLPDLRHASTEKADAAIEDWLREESDFFGADVVISTRPSLVPTEKAEPAQVVVLVLLVFVVVAFLGFLIGFALREAPPPLDVKAAWQELRDGNVAMEGGDTEQACRHYRAVIDRAEPAMDPWKNARRAYADHCEKKSK